MHPQCDNIELKKTQTTIPLVCFRVYDIWLVKNQLGRHLRWNYMPLHPLNEFRGSKLSVNDKKRDYHPRVWGALSLPNLLMKPQPYATDLADVVVFWAEKQLSHIFQGCWGIICKQSTNPRKGWVVSGTVTAVLFRSVVLCPLYNSLPFFPACKAAEEEIIAVYSRIIVHFFCWPNTNDFAILMVI